MSEEQADSWDSFSKVDPWPHEPPPDLLDALDRAAARLSELDAHGVCISLGIGADGGPRAQLSQEGLAWDIDSSRLLQLVCGSEPIPVGGYPVLSSGSLSARGEHDG
jgi:hypothetical protein